MQPAAGARNSHRNTRNSFDLATVFLRKNPFQSRIPQFKPISHNRQKNRAKNAFFFENFSLYFTAYGEGYRNGLRTKRDQGGDQRRVSAARPPTPPPCWYRTCRRRPTWESTGEGWKWKQPTGGSQTRLPLSGCCLSVQTPQPKRGFRKGVNTGSDQSQRVSFQCFSSTITPDLNRLSRPSIAGIPFNKAHRSVGRKTTRTVRFPGLSRQSDEAPALSRARTPLAARRQCLIL